MSNSASSLKSFNDKVVWITGASSGIGKSLSLALAERGACLILSGRNLAELEAVKASCQSSQRHQILAFDLCQPQALPEIAEQAWLLNGRIDVLVNNAGISQRSLAEETSLEVDRKVMEVDYFAPVALTKALLPHFMASRGGVIINIASVAGKIGSPMRSAYSAAKHALIGFMDCLRAEVHVKGIRVVNVCPGWVNTNISRNALTGDMTTYSQQDDEIATGMSPQTLVERLLSQLGSSNNEILIAEGKPRLGYWLRGWMPNTYHRLLPKIYQRKQ